MSKKLFLIILIATVIALGFLRDSVFIYINKQIDTGVDIGGRLALLKWALTFVFSVFYLVLTAAMLHVIFRFRIYVWIAAWTYLALFAVALFAGGIGILFFPFSAVYPFVRTVMGIAQSPVVMMILISACFVNNAFWEK